MSLPDNVQSLPLSPAPVERIPAEILIEIVVVTTDALAPLTFSSVCRFWREVITSSPRVWQLIQLDDKRALASSKAQAELWLRRSAPLHFDVNLHTECHDLVLPLLSPFLPYLHRWRDFSMSGLRDELTSLRDLFRSSEAALTDLALNVCSEQDAAFDDVLDPRNTFEQYSPLWPNRIVMNVWLSNIPYFPSSALLGLKIINISEQSLSDHLGPEAVLKFLSFCPLVEEFSLNGLFHDDITLPRIPVAIPLPHLRVLKLRSTCSARAILSSIDCPSLAELYLTHLNVDFRLSGDYHEGDDSDEEVPDRSSSPWSDRATGMGMRKLLSRCSPPIKRLEMDFADIRSKDFTHVFERLLHLEDLLIVGSDMSDDVMELLRPLPCSGGVMLPKLRNLELYNCPGLSCEVVVDVLVERVRFTDRVTPEDTLVEVALVGCDVFPTRLEHILIKELGQRIRLDD